jgi:hypothetical protein
MVSSFFRGWPERFPVFGQLKLFARKDIGCFSRQEDSSALAAVRLLTNPAVSPLGFYAKSEKTREKQAEITEERSAVGPLAPSPEEKGDRIYSAIESFLSQFFRRIRNVTQGEQEFVHASGVLQCGHPLHRLLQSVLLIYPENQCFVTEEKIILTKRGEYYSFHSKSRLFCTDSQHPNSSRNERCFWFRDFPSRPCSDES